MPSIIGDIAMSVQQNEVVHVIKRPVTHVVRDAAVALVTVAVIKGVLSLVMNNK